MVADNAGRIPCSSIGGPPVVEFRNVSCDAPHGGAKILTNLTLSIEKAESLVLLGESGCGKTTTLRLINGLMFPKSGEVLVDGLRTTAWDPIRLRRRAGYVLQDAGLFPHFTVERNIAVVPTLEGWAPSRIRDRVRELLCLVGLDPDTYACRYPNALSGGQRQRVGLARALAADPPLLLLDEPFGALDPLTRAALQCEFADLRARLGKTAVLVTHDLREALQLGTRIGLLRGGKLVLLEDPSGFLEAENSYARAYQNTLRWDEAESMLLSRKN